MHLSLNAQTDVNRLLTCLICSIIRWCTCISLLDLCMTRPDERMKTALLIYEFMNNQFHGEFW